MPTSPSGLSTFTFTGDLTPDRLRLHSRSIMIALSHAIEEQAALSGPDTVLIATFQRLSLLIPEAQRYGQIAPLLKQTFALGVPDVAPDPIPGVTVLPLAAGDRLTEEWVVIASGPTCCAALFSRDTEGFRLNRRSRRFAGYWTTSSAEIDRALRRFYQAIGQEPLVIRREHGAGARTAAAIRKTLTRLTNFR